MNKEDYNKQNLISKILNDRYNLYTKRQLRLKHFATLKNLERNNLNRAIDDAQDEYNF